MDINTIWETFLIRIQDKLAPLLFSTWFDETFLIKLDDNKAVIKVPSYIHKKHLKENYNDLISEIFDEITGSNFTFEYMTDEELESNITIDIDKVGVPNNNLDSNLNNQYTFDNYVIGESNKFAKFTSLAVAEQPGSMYNPLFIYGSSGLGKTHLMHAIGNYIVENSKKRVLYVTSEQFVNDFLELYRKSQDDNNFELVDRFKKKYRDIDVLMIDDIQYLEIAHKTQQEFFNTFNDLHTNNKQIVICSDRSPDDLKKLEERLRTRFNWGITVNIFPPDFELRMNIIDKKIDSEILENNFPIEVKEYIASNCTSDIRKLEGAIRRVYAYATMMNGSDITLDLAIEALKDFFTQSIISKNKIEQVQQLVANKYNITIEDLKSKKRVANISIPRQIAMYICRIVLSEPLTKIGIEFGGKDHTTVMYSAEKIANEIKNNESLKKVVDEIVEQIK